MHLSRLFGRDKGCGRRGEDASRRSPDASSDRFALLLKGFQWSLCIHGMLFLAFVMVSTTVVPHDKIMVIDFDLLGVAESPATGEAPPGRVSMPGPIPPTNDNSTKADSFSTALAAETEPVDSLPGLADVPAALPTNDQGKSISSPRVRNKQKTTSSTAKTLSKSPPIPSASFVNLNAHATCVTPNSEIPRTMNLNETATDIEGSPGVTSAAARTEVPKTMNHGEIGSDIGGSSGSSGAAARSEASKAAYLREQYLYIRERIVNGISYPSLARRMGWCGRVKIAFVVCEDGGVDNVRVLESSGFTLLDTNTIDTVKKVAPFPRPPVSAEIRMAITFRLD